MNRTMVAGLSALFLVACSKESTTPAGSPPAAAVATDAQVTLELGKTI